MKKRYQFPEEINNTNFFRFPRSLIRDKHWAKLPNSSKRIFPVIAVHAGKKGLAFPGQTTIATLAGCDVKTVRKGIKGLNGFPGIYLDWRLNNWGRREYQYRVKIADPHNPVFFLYKSFFEGGNWCNLTATAQALFPVLNTFSSFDPLIYIESLEGESATEAMELFGSDGLLKGRESFDQRAYDFCGLENEDLAEYAGIALRSVNAALESLVGNFFIERYEEEDMWKVFRRPKQYYIRELLNR